MRIGTVVWVRSWALLAALVVVGCGTSTGGDIEIAGSYTDGFAQHQIGGVRWTMSGMDFSAGFTVMRVNNDEDWAVAQNDAENAFNPGQWSRFEWVRADGTLYFCQSTFDAATEAAAVGASRPDRSSPATTGCGTFPWSVLTPNGR